LSKFKTIKYTGADHLVSSLSAAAYILGAIMKISVCCEQF